MDEVHTFLVERFGADPSEYSVYVGSDWGAVAHHASRLAVNRWWDDRVRRLSLPLQWDYGCSIGVTNWLIHSLNCGQSLDHKSYINSHIRVLLQDKGQLDPPPLWLEAGGGMYLELSYRTAETATFDDELAEYAGLVRQETVPLQQLEAAETWQTTDSEKIRALSVLAVNRLLTRADESALFEYYRLLPRDAGSVTSQGSWQAAFESAFGLTLEDFYEQFEAYRATLQ